MGMVPRFDIRQRFEDSKHIIIAAFGHLVKQAQETQRCRRHDSIFGVFALWGKEDGHLDTEQLGKVIQPASGDAVYAVFVFLDLRRADSGWSCRFIFALLHYCA